MAYTREDWAAIQAGRQMAAAYQPGFNEAFPDRVPKPVVPGAMGDAGASAPVAAPRLSLLAPSAASVPMRQPLFNAQGQEVSAPGLSNAATVNEKLARMNPRAVMWRQRQLAKADAAMGGSEFKNQYLRNAMLRNDAALGIGPQLPGTRPGEKDNPNYVHIANPMGQAMDTDMAANYDAYDPGVRASMEQGMREVNREMSRLFASPDKGKWGSVEDLEKAVNSLESVKKWGGLLEGYVSDAARRNMSPQLKAQFDANDATVKSFYDWYAQNGYDAGTVDEALTGRDPYEVWTGDDPAAMAIKERFRSDAGAKKYEAIGDRVMPVGLTPDQQMQQTFSVEDKQMARIEQQAEQDKAAISAIDPERAKRMYFSRTTRRLEELAPGQRTPEQFDADLAVRNLAYKAAGVGKTSIRVPDGKGGYTMVDIDESQRGMYADLGNASFNRMKPEQQDAVVLEIITNETLAKGQIMSVEDRAAKAKAAVMAASMRQAYGLTGKDLQNPQPAQPPTQRAEPHNVPPARPVGTPAFDALPQPKRATIINAVTATLTSRTATPDEKAKARRLAAAYGLNADEMVREIEALQTTGTR